MDAATGWFTGVPEEVGVFQVTLQAINAQGTSEGRLRLHINPTPPTFAKPSWVWHAPVGMPARFPIPVFGLPTEYAAEGLPEGWSLDPSAGLLTGTGPAPGDHQVTLRVRNPMGEATASFVLRVSPVIELGPVGPLLAEVPAGLESAVALAAGAEHTLALTAEGRVRVWGDNGYGQVALTPPLRQVVALAAGWGHNLALTADGHVTGRGWNVYGQGDLSPGVSNALAVAAGYHHSLALTRDGRVVAWGLNDSGQTAVPADLADVVAIAAGGHHSLALRADGRVVAWGNSAARFSNAVPAGTDHVVVPAAQAEHAVALVLPRHVGDVPRVFLRVEEDQVLLNWVGGRGPYRVWQAWDLKPDRWTPWGGLRPVRWAVFPAEPDHQFLRVESR